MSWIVTFLKLKRIEVDTTVPEWWKTELLPLGTKAEIMSLLKEWFPNSNFSDPSWISVVPWVDIGEVLLSGNDLASDASLIMWIGFRGPTYRILRDVSEKTGWVAWNPSDGRLIDFNALPSHFFKHEYPSLSQTRSALSADQVVDLRNKLVDAIEQNDRASIATLANTLSNLRASAEKNGEGLYWSILDDLSYVAQYPTLAKWKLTIPTEVEIRGNQPK